MKIISYVILAMAIVGFLTMGAAAEESRCLNTTEERAKCLDSPVSYDFYKQEKMGAYNERCLPYVVPSDVDGEPKDAFTTGENLYCYGKRFIPFIPVRIYVVEYQDTWNQGDPLTDVSGGYDWVSPNICGNFDNTLIWESIQTEGTYEVVLDTLHYGKWDWWEPRATITVISNEIPEFSTIALPVALLLGLVYYMNRRKSNQE